MTGQLWGITTTTLQVRIKLQLNTILFQKTLVRKDIASSNPDTPKPAPGADADAAHSRNRDGDSLPDAAKAGIAVAAAVAVIVIATTGGVLLWRRRRHLADREGLTDLDAATAAAGAGRHPVY